MIFIVAVMVAALVYIITRASDSCECGGPENGRKCGNCGYEIGNDYNYCPNCEDVLRRKCEKCGKMIDVDWRRCPYCE